MGDNWGTLWKGLVVMGKGGVMGWKSKYPNTQKCVVKND